MRHRTPEAAEAFANAMRELYETGRITPSPPSEEATALATVMRQQLGQSPTVEAQPEQEQVVEWRPDRSQGAIGAAVSPSLEFGNFLNDIAANRSIGHL